MIPNDVLRFEVLLYLSLLLDALSAAFFGVATDDVSGATQAVVSLLSAFIIVALAVLVWLAARQRKNWARWSLLGFFVLTVVLYIQSFGDMVFGVRTLVDMLSVILSAFGFYFAFTSKAGPWFKPANP